MSQYQIVLKRTDEINSKEWDEYSYGFNKVFNKDFTKEYFKEKYFGCSLGYSYHGVLLCEDKIVGMFTVIPRQYIYFGKEVTIGLGCDAFILAEHRKDEYFLKEMADVVTFKLKSEGISNFISIPNKAAYPYWKYYGGWKDIGKLDYYIVPLRVSKLLQKYDFLDAFSFSFFKSTISFFTFLNFFSNKSVKKPIQLKYNKEYFSQRYSSEYKIREISVNNYFVYRVYNEDNIRTAYLIDCYPLSSRNIANAINKIIIETKGEIDIILFVGKINSHPFFLIKVPEEKEPRLQPFIGLSLDEKIDENYFSINSWGVSLANFDNR